MAEEVQAASGEENLNPVAGAKANLEEERHHVQDGMSDTSQVECQTKEAQSKEEDLDKEEQRGHSRACDTLCRCHKQRALTMQRAVNARRQAEGLRMQLSHAQAYTKDVGIAWKRRVEEMEAEYNEQIKDLMAEADRLRARLAVVDGQCCTCKARSKQLEKRNEELEDKLAAIQQNAQEQLDMVLQKHKTHCTSLLLQLGEERSRSRTLKAEVGRLREQAQVLEEHLQMALIELRHREEVLEAFGTQALERLAATVGVEGRADLLRLIAVLKGSSWPVGGFQATGGVSASAKCDSGYQGSIGEGHSKLVHPSVTPPVKVDPPEKDVETDEITKAKRRFRRSNEKVERLLRLTLVRECQASLLEDRLSSPETLSKMRTSSSGFVPTCAISPLPGPTRKVLRKKQLLASTPHGALETLADVSSICQDVTDNSVSLGSQLDEVKDSSGSVFLWESSGRQNVGGGCPNCKDQDSPSLNRPVAKDTPSLRAESAVTPDNSLQQDSPNNKKISSKTRRVSSTVVTKNVSRNSLGDRKAKACRSLDFSRPEATVLTMPFTFSTGGSTTPASGVSDISFTASGPVVLNLNLVPR